MNHWIETLVQALYALIIERKTFSIKGVHASKVFKQSRSHRSEIRLNQDKGAEKAKCSCQKVSPYKSF